MRRFPFVLLALTSLPLVPAVAQRGPEANLVLTILAGTITGHSLWTVEKQPLCLGNPCSGLYDTLHLARSINSSTMLGVAATFFPSPHLGFHAEVSYVGLPIDSGCSGVFNPDAQHTDEQICDDISAQAASGGAIAILGGLTLRAASRRAFSPYVRGSLGLVSLSRSTIEVSGRYLTSGGAVVERVIIVDDTPRRTSPMVGAAVGFTSPIGSGYQFRLEARDILTALDRLIGPANSLGEGPTAKRYYHHFALTLGLDVVLEKKRGRRY